MAVADQTTVAAMVRRFADLLADEPAVERIWYATEPPRAPWSSAYLTVWIQVGERNEDVDRRVAGAVLEVWPPFDLNEDVSERGIEVSVVTFVPDWLPDRNLEEVMETGVATEITVRGR